MEIRIPTREELEIGRKMLKGYVNQYVSWQKIYDPGCCEHQGVRHQGYRVIFAGTHALTWCLWGKRGDCGRHEPN